MAAASPRTSSPNLHQHLVEKACELLPQRSASILDLGCGNGALLQKFVALGYHNLVGVDIKPPASTSEVVYEQVDLDYFKLRQPPGSFDLILAVEVIEHIENLGLFLAESFRLLKPGGQALFTTPNLHSAQSKLLFAFADRLKQFDAKGDPTHVTPIVMVPFTRLLHRHGLTVVDAWAFPLSGHSPTSRAAMRFVARTLRPILKTHVGHGDTLCLLIQKTADLAQNVDLDHKADRLTAHY